MARDDHAIETTSEDVAKSWVTPRVTRFSAGSAEDASGPSTDTILNPS